MRKIIFISLLALSFFFMISNASAEINATWCCQKTTTNFFCQNAPVDECAPNFLKSPTSCASTSYCKPGVCYNPNQGTCADNTPQFVCEENGGKWSDQPLPQCDLGCCLLGDQAAFVTQVRCNYLAGTLGLQSNFNKAIKNEAQCILSAQNQDKGACVYESTFVKTCKFTTREECTGGVNGTRTKGEFFKDKLCTAPELGTNCAKTNKATCIVGKEEVYFVDTCGNPANIFDSGQVNSIEYWSNAKTKDQSCNPASANINSKNCGNCNYLQGSICRSADGNSQAGYLDYICTDLNCDNGKKHGESWCVFDDKGSTGDGKNAVGSRFYKHVCMNGEEFVESCADFRQEECIEDTIEIPGGKSFSQAACRVNRWQDCNLQDNQEDCENYDRRDCLWKPGLTALFSNSTEGLCIPKNPPGLKFWEGEEAKNLCARGSVTCLVKFEKGLLDSGKGECKENCECLEKEWVNDRNLVCSSLGDCGSNINWLGKDGGKAGFKVIFGKITNPDDKDD
ncbi:MAG: hypothetical protein Q8Q31_00175 [Nanoarchaeota archaeon]|nr:hypothetical protein [Nanoarchaeota archaeon]